MEISRIMLRISGNKWKLIEKNRNGNFCSLLIVLDSSRFIIIFSYTNCSEVFLFLYYN